MENGNSGNNNDEWETDSMDSENNEPTDQANKEKRKHGRSWKGADFSKKRAHGSRGTSVNQASSSRERETLKQREEEARPDAALTGNDLPPALEDADSDDEWRDEPSDAMDTDGDSHDEQTRETEDPVLKKPSTDPKLLIAPLPPTPAHMALPALLLTREFSGLTNYVSPALIRQKLTGHRDTVQRFALYAKLEHHTGCVNALNFNPSGTVLASGSDDRNVDLWDWSKKQLKYSFPTGHISNVFQCKFMPLSNDSLMVTAARDGHVRLAQFSSAGGLPAMKTLCRHQQSCHKIDVRPDASHQILTCGEDAAVYNLDIREARSRKCLTVYEKKTKIRLYSIMSNPHKAVEFVVGGYDRFVRVFDLRKLDKDCKHVDRSLAKLCPPIIRQSNRPYHVSSAVFNHNGSEILASYNDYNIFLFKNDLSDPATVIHEYEGHRNDQTVKGVNFYGPRSEFVVSGSDCGTIFFWDKATARIVHYLDGDEIGAVNVLEPHPTDPILATSGLEHSVKVWAPTANSKADLNKLIPIITKNDRGRRQAPGFDDGNFFMMLMHHIQRRARAPPRVPPRPAAPANPDEMPHLEENSDDEDGHGEPGVQNCATS